MDTFRTATPYPFCPGCGHGLILDQLNAALVKLQLDPRQTVIVSDIGCVGLADPCFITNTFHGLHGRSVAYASGIKLANPELAVIVVIGDGGSQASVAALRFRKLVFRLPFRHFVVMSQLADHAAKCSQAVACARPTPV